MITLFQSSSRELSSSIGVDEKWTGSYILCLVFENKAVLSYTACSSYTVCVYVGQSVFYVVAADCMKRAGYCFAYAKAAMFKVWTEY